MGEVTGIASNQVSSSALGGATSGATFSPCRRYRYALWREWGDSSRRVAFIGLNPSTADETEDDPTIRRCIGFARAWGAGAFDMLNLFAWRSTEPLGLLDAADPIGPDNDAHIARIVDRADRVVLAWGSHRKGILPILIDTRAAAVRTFVRRVASGSVGHLGTNADGQPKHPLYLKAATEFTAIEVRP